MAISNAIPSDAVARTVGYEIKKGNFATSTPNLPQRIAIIGSANSANQVSLKTTPQELFTSSAAAKLYGYGSPIHSVMRILRPISGDGVGSIPTVCYGVVDPGSSVAAKATIGITAASVTKSITHTLVINGRDNVDGMPYSYSVQVGDSATVIANKIADAVNAVISAPVIATVSTTSVTLTAKFKGAISSELSVEVKAEDVAGVTYAVSAIIAGSGVHAIADAIASIGDEWNTIIVNCFDTTSILTAFELFNGIADDKSGRYTASNFKPCVVLTGSTKNTYADLIAVTDSRKNEMTNVICPAPKSKGFTYEAAANVAYLLANQNSLNPAGTISGKRYPDMPTPLDGIIGDMSNSSIRDNIIKKGCSIVTLNGGKYQVENIVTTYHPDDEVVPQYRFVRTLMIDWNIAYSYRIVEAITVKDKTLVGSNQTVNVTDTIKPKGWKAVIMSLSDDLSTRALIVEPEFMKNSIRVEVSAVNPNRLDTFFRYKRSGIANILSTTAEAGFSYNLK